MDPNEKPGAPGDPNFDESGDEAQYDQMIEDEGGDEGEETQPRTPEKKPLSIEDIPEDLQLKIQLRMLGEGAEEHVKSRDQLARILHDQRVAHVAKMEAEDQARAQAERGRPLSRAEEIERDLQILAIQDRNEGCSDREVEQRYRARYMEAIKRDAVNEVRQEMFAQRERGKALDIYFREHPHIEPLREYVERDLDAGIPPQQVLMHYKQVADTYKRQMLTMSPGSRGGGRTVEEPQSSRAFSAEAYQRAVESVRDQTMDADNLVPNDLDETREAIKKAPRGANLFSNKYWAKAAARHKKEMQD